MFDELSKQHTTHVYAANGNSIYPDMPPYDPSTRYDLGLLNHGMCLRYLRDKKIDKIVFTSHGVIPGAEKPVDGADIYVSVSEEVQSMLAKKGFESFVIRNPIDTDKFRTDKPTNRTLKAVAFISNNPRTSTIATLKEATAGLRFEEVGRQHQLRDIRPVIQRADLIVGLGRTVYEAMSMGRNAIIFDYKGADGFVDTESIFRFRESNCSGRTNKLRWGGGQLAQAMERYDPDLGEQLREYIKEHNNVETIAERYLCL